MASDAKLIAELIRRRDAGELIADASPGSKLQRTLPVAKIATVETTIGRRLPPLLTRIYTEVANGGFGDSYGLLALSVDQRMKRAMMQSTCGRGRGLKMIECN